MDLGNFDVIKAISLAALGAFKMNMFMMMLSSGAMIFAESVFQASLIVEYFMNNTLVEKGF